MNLKHGRDINTIGEAMLLTDEQKEYMGKLPIGYGIVKLQSRHYKPFLVKFPFIEVKKGSVIDERIRTWFKGYSDKFKVIPSDLGEMEVILDIQPGDNIVNKIKLGDKEVELLMDIAEFPTSGIADRFRRLKITAYRGYKILNYLLSSDLVKSCSISTLNGRVRFLQLSKKGRQIVKEQGINIAENGGGPEHEYWKLKIGEEMKGNGYDIEYEKRIDDHYVDIVATKEQEKIAIEIETGKSDAIANITRNLHIGFTKVICMVLTNKTFNYLINRYAQDIKVGKLIVKKLVKGLQTYSLSE